MADEDNHVINHLDDTYDLPVIMNCLRRQRWAKYVPFLPTFAFKRKKDRSDQGVD